MFSDFSPKNKKNKNFCSNSEFLKSQTLVERKRKLIESDQRGGQVHDNDTRHLHPDQNTTRRRGARCAEHQVPIQRQKENGNLRDGDIVYDRHGQPEQQVQIPELVAWNCYRQIILLPM